MDPLRPVRLRRPAQDAGQALHAERLQNQILAGLCQHIQLDKPADLVQFDRFVHQTDGPAHARLTAAVQDQTQIHRVHVHDSQQHVRIPARQHRFVQFDSNRRLAARPLAAGLSQLHSPVNERLEERTARAQHRLMTGQLEAVRVRVAASAGRPEHQQGVGQVCRLQEVLHVALERCRRAELGLQLSQHVQLPPAAGAGSQQTRTVELAAVEVLQQGVQQLRVDAGRADPDRYRRAGPRLVLQQLTKVRTAR